ncbi:Retrovirus-related Pol polyprotein from transposon 297 [Mytilus coruscus]|uniref:Retrovirus-related Pol polyprotein from transposon 297 n=1 Tax=Mytilus coruscus TaxID=42192 RepID=A0A6J8DP46_MYTCO|nr:Retrovirus-related Pol polyprotein from transposon 297 [Mytilus coruscus]
MDDLQLHISTLEEETRRTDLGDVTKLTVQTQLQRADDAPTLFGPYISEQAPGVRLKQVQYNTTSAASCTSSGDEKEKERRQRASETLPELGRTIRRLVNRAYPLAPIEAKETLSKDYFFDALHDSEMRIKIKQSRPQNLNQVICLAVELEAFYKAEKRQEFVKPQMRAMHVDTSTQEVSSKDDKFTEMMDLFSKQLESLRMELNEFKKSGQRNSADPERKRNQQCYSCGKYGHFKRECKLRKQGGNENGQYRNHENGSARPVHSQTRKQRRKQIKLNVQNNSTKEAGAYIDVVIGNIKSSFLVDTGATVTLISNKLFNSLRKEEMLKLNQVVQTIMSANGTELNVAGKGEFHIWIEQKEYLSEAVVADLAIEGIIGLDFFRENGCLINLQEEHMVCHDQKIPLNFTGQLGCYRVSVVEDTCIQPGTEALVRGHINEFPSTKNEVGLGVIEPCDKFIARDNALMARTLVKASEIVPLRFMNVSNLVKTIRAGTIVGNISPVKDVISDNTNITVKQNDPVLTSDRDLGRTNLVRHTINTGNNAPVKQPPRRIPIYMREEADRHIDDMLEHEVIEPADVDASELRSFLGLCGYYRMYIENLAKIAKCLHQLTEKGRKFLWTEECQEAFEALKGKLTKAPILAHPDLSRHFILDTDASNNAIGAVLSHEIDSKERVIAFGSRTLSKTERKYCVTRKEILSVVHFVKSFRHFLYGRTFIVRTDHSSLQRLLNFKNAEGKLTRWLEVLST